MWRHEEHVDVSGADTEYVLCLSKEIKWYEIDFHVYIVRLDRWRHFVLN